MDIFYERRRLTKPEDRIAIDLARHLQARHMLGVAVVLCDNPHALMSAVRKQWLRLTRNVQRQRASTLNAEEILRHTRAIMYMQNAQFTVRSPEAQPGATVYFQAASKSSVPQIPSHCASLYIANDTPLPNLEKCANDALVVYYEGDVAAFLHPHSELEERAMQEWQEVARLLKRHGINPELLSLYDFARQPVLDKALDVLIDSPEEFLTLAYDFQHALDKAQPLHSITKDNQRIFEAVARLAYRVNVLTPQNRAPRPLATLPDTENYFLRDPGMPNSSVGLLICDRPIYRRSATIYI